VASFAWNGQNYVVSAGWDCLVKFFTVMNGSLNQIGESYVGKPVHHMSLSFPLMVTSHSEKFFHVWNLELIRNNQFAPVSVSESPLKYATSSLCAFADGKGFAIGSIEGRCGVNDVNF
jgi:hypothetical protein